MLELECNGICHSDTNGFGRPYIPVWNNLQSIAYLKQFTPHQFGRRITCCGRKRKTERKKKRLAGSYYPEMHENNCTLIHRKKLNYSQTKFFFFLYKGIPKLNSTVHKRQLSYKYLSAYLNLCPIICIGDMYSPVTGLNNSRIWEFHSQCIL